MKVITRTLVKLTWKPLEDFEMSQVYLVYKAHYSFCQETGVGKGGKLIPLMV